MSDPQAPASPPYKQSIERENALWRLIGSKDFDRVSDFRDWIRYHKHGAEIFAFLQAEQATLLPPSAQPSPEA